MAAKASKRDAQPRRHGLGALGYAWLILITAVVGLAGWAQFFREETEPTQFVAQIDLPPVASLPVPLPPPAEAPDRHRSPRFRRPCRQARRRLMA